MVAPWLLKVDLYLLLPGDSITNLIPGRCNSLTDHTALTSY